MATEWKVIRVSAEVLDGLQRVRDSLWRAHESGLVDGVLSRVNSITDNAVVEYLVRHYQKHRERRTRSKRVCRARRKRAKDGCDAGVGPAGSPATVASVEETVRTGVLQALPVMASSDPKGMTCVPTTGCGAVATSASHEGK